MKTAFFASALLAMAAGPFFLFSPFSNSPESHSSPPLFPGLEIDWVVTGEETTACVAPRETVNFKWEGPYHNVVELGDDEGAYIDCILSEDQTEAVEGPWSTTLTEEGVYFFLCGVKTHCSAGNQKAEIVVSTNC